MGNTTLIIFIFAHLFNGDLILLKIFFYFDNSENQCLNNAADKISAQNTKWL